MMSRGHHAKGGVLDNLQGLRLIEPQNLSIDQTLIYRGHDRPPADHP